MPRKLAALILCVVGMGCSSLFCFNWGFTLFDVVDHYLNVYLMLFLGVLECLACGWVYEAEAIMKQVGKPAVLVLGIGFWSSLIITGLVTFTVFP
jgi:SNF family Na+-dependent transporter